MTMMISPLGIRRRRGHHHRRSLCNDFFLFLSFMYIYILNHHSPIIGIFSLPLGIQRGTMLSSSIRMQQQKQQHSSFASSSSVMTMEEKTLSSSTTKGKVLVLGGSGFLGGNVAKRAVLEGYSVTSLSRRGRTTTNSNTNNNSNPSMEFFENKIDYRIGDAREKKTIESILAEGGYVAVIHCIGLLLDSESGLGNYNKFASGSGSIPDTSSTYETITKQTAFHAIEAWEMYINKNKNNNNNNNQQKRRLPFIFVSAAEAGWPQTNGGPFIESMLAPEFLRRYLSAKRSVEQRMGIINDKSSSSVSSSSSSSIDSSLSFRPVIFRPSLIYTKEKIESWIPVGAFILGNAIGLSFIDRPVTVQSLSLAIIRCIDDESIVGIQRFMDIDNILSK